MKTFYVTFGVKYREEPHPIWSRAHPDGYLTVVAVDEDMARRLTAALLATNWAAIYDENHFNPGRWSKGELGRIEFSEDPVKLAKDYICPRCGGDVPNSEHKGEYPGALSRVDNQTEICSDCGTDEAMTQFLNNGLIQPISAWPLSKK